MEKDAAFERRFQQVFVAEPSVVDTISILRGLKERYEGHHGVRIQDRALVMAAQLSSRYITGMESVPFLVCSCVCFVYLEFVFVLKVVLEVLDDSDSSVKELALSLIVEMLKNQVPTPFVPFLFWGLCS